MDFINERLVEFENYIKGRKVAIIGLGVSNLPLIDYMNEKDAITTIFDDRTKEKIDSNIIKKIENYNMQAFLGENSLENLKGFDIIFRSPSCLPTKPELVAESERGAIVTSEIEMLMKMCPCKIIGVTGSDGKTTTTTLIYKIISENGYKCYVGGNIGTPLFTKLNEITPEDVVVLELSSFQLMGMDVSPNVAVITNITPNHLNIHSSLEEYIDAKKNIFKYQNENDLLVLNYDNEVTNKCGEEAIGKVVYFTSKNKIEDGWMIDDGIIKECVDKLRKHIANTKDFKLRGMHNYENICAALAATKQFVDTKQAVKTIMNFNGVEHRLELIREIDGVKWYNDSVSSSPTRTIAGLNSYDEEIILIAGGYDKNLDYTPIAKPIVEKVKGLILLGDTSTKIFNAVKAELEKQNKNIPIYMCEDLKQTVTIAKKIAKPGQVVLFSPASASFDLFKNFADRGEKFKKLVNEL